MPPADPPHDLLGVLADRWSRAQDPELDAQALVRLTILEARSNVALLDLAVGEEEALSPAALWEIPPILQTPALGAVLGQGALALPAFAGVRRLKPTEADAGLEPADIMTQLYVRITALKALASLRKRGGLKRVRIRNRLENLRTDFTRVVAALARDVKK
jgi:hypothetical protein